MSSSSSSSVSTTVVNGRQVVSGLSSGLDVDSIIKQTITADSAKLNKLKQKEQLDEWKQTAYRTTVSEIQAFSDKYFSITSASSLLNKSSYQKFTVDSSSTAVTATTTTDASEGSHTIAVSQLATAATRTGSSTLSKAVQGTTAADYSSAVGKSFTVSLDGTTKTVTLDSSVTDVSSLQTAINQAVGDGKVTISTDSGTGALVIKAADSGVQKITLGSTSNSALSALGFGSGAVLSNRISTGDTLETLAGTFNNTFSFNSDGQIELSINGTGFTFDKSETLDAMMTEINDNNDAGVTIKYNSLTDKLVMTAKQSGAGNTLDVSETGSTFLTAALDQATDGTDAKLTLDGQQLTRSANSVTVDGIIYTLKNTTSEAETVDVSQDVDGIYDTISNFVTDYNALISTINTSITEEYDSDYPPLTDAQKDEMTDDEITKWETKAKTGILQNDSMLEDFLDDMQSALSNSVSGNLKTLSQIGITTISYDTKGKLQIDESTLKQAIQSNPEGVMKIFAQESSSYSGTSSARRLNASQRQTRYQEEGVAYRLYDVLQNNISTVRDNNNQKGLLIEEAGVEDDTSYTDNTLSDDIDELNDQIDTEQDRLDDEEDSLYTKYTNLETYISKMNAQLSSLQSMMS